MIRTALTASLAALAASAALAQTPAAEEFAAGLADYRREHQIPSFSVIVLQDGVVIEIGSHDQLMALGGLYSRLYRMNYASFDDIPEEEIARLTRADGET